MIAYLKFNLDNPDDKKNHIRCIKSTDAYLALWRIDELLRHLINKDDISEEQLEITHDILKHVYHIMQDYNINLEDIS